MTTLSGNASLKEELKAKYVGKTLYEVPTPSCVLDLAKLESNCERMLDATQKLDILWRPHIKTHKTTELTRLQVGDTLTTPVHILVSTVLEAENILPLLEEYKSKGRAVNVLFAFPLFPSAVYRLAAISSALGPDGLSVMIDHPDQLIPASHITQISGYPPLAFLKIDVGYGRAGVVLGSDPYQQLVDAVLDAERRGDCRLHGLYAHAGQSYGLRKDWTEAMKLLAAEFDPLYRAAQHIRSRGGDTKGEMVLTVGATPTASSVQHPTLLEGAAEGPMQELRGAFKEYREAGYKLELHAGVYATLDLQQLATHSRVGMSADDIAISVMAEVASVYPGRGPEGRTEALVNAGCLALGREPVTDKGDPPGKDYNGWGMLTPWRLGHYEPINSDFPREHGGWQVSRISQEHGILLWNGPKDDERKAPLKVGQRVRIWPNHSCIAGACFDYYFIVDSRNKGREEVVVDVWPRWRGW